MLSRVFLAILLAGAVAGIPALLLAAPVAAENSNEPKVESHEHIGHANAGPELNKPEEYKWDLSLYTFVVFLLLMGILAKFAWGPIAAGLEKREHGIAEQIEAAEEANKEAHGLLAQYEKKLAAAQDQVRAMIEQARQDGESNKQAILAEAKAGAEAEKMRAVRDIELATDKALKDLAERSANLAVELAGKIVKAKLSAADHSKLIQDAVAKFPNATPSRN